MHDKEWVKDIFWKRKGNGSANFDIEDDYDFKFMIHERDFIAGRTIAANIMDGIEKSRRVIFILSRFVCTNTNQVFWAEPTPFDRC